MLFQKKYVNPNNLEAKVKELRAANKSIATLNGSFDLLHAGHLYIITEAAKQADVLFMLLNSDSSIQKYKSANRPIIPLKYRMDLIGALEDVSYVSFFDETTPCNILEKIRPNVHVNSVEYGADCIEAKTVRSFGGKVVIVDRIDGLSTSAIIAKIQELECV